MAALGVAHLTGSCIKVSSALCLAFLLNQEETFPMDAVTQTTNTKGSSKIIETKNSNELKLQKINTLCSKTEEWKADDYELRQQTSEMSECVLGQYNYVWLWPSQSSLDTFRAMQPSSSMPKQVLTQTQMRQLDPQWYTKKETEKHRLEDSYKILLCHWRWMERVSIQKHICL